MDISDPAPRSDVACSYAAIELGDGGTGAEIRFEPRG
jgi:hypothetical protein